MFLAFHDDTAVVYDPAGKPPPVLVRTLLSSMGRLHVLVDDTVCLQVTGVWSRSLCSVRAHTVAILTLSGICGMWAVEPTTGTVDRTWSAVVPVRDAVAVVACVGGTALVVWRNRVTAFPERRLVAALPWDACYAVGNHDGTGVLVWTRDGRLVFVDDGAGGGGGVVRTVPSVTIPRKVKMLTARCIWAQYSDTDVRLLSTSSGATLASGADIPSPRWRTQWRDVSLRCVWLAAVLNQQDAPAQQGPLQDAVPPQHAPVVHA
jgi:hypothetical protein